MDTDDNDFGGQCTVYYTNQGSEASELYFLRYNGADWHDLNDLVTTALNEGAPIYPIIYDMLFLDPPAPQYDTLCNQSQIDCLDCQAISKTNNLITMDGFQTGVSY